jgi:Fe-S cluster biosynthesis and repair protein YggX
MNKLPQGIVPSDASVQIFGNIVKEAYTQVYQLLGSGDYSTEIKRKRLLNQIKSVVDSSDEAIQAWIKVEIPTFYEMGMFEATKGINDRGGIVRVDDAFVHFHEEALQALSNGIYSDIASSMQGLTRTGERFIGMGAQQAITQQIGKGQITGENIRSIRNSISRVLQREGITAMRDKGGREWDLNRYAEMLARTKLTQAHNTGVTNRMVESGYDLVVISNHFGACDLCAPFEGKILSITGRNKEYMSIDQAQSEGLFHPNCRHVPTPYHEAFLDVAVGWDKKEQRYRPYNELRKDIVMRNKAPIEKGVKATPIDKALKTLDADQAGGRLQMGGNNYTLTPFEAKFVRTSGVRIVDVPKGGKKNTFGAYYPNDNRIEYYEKANVESTKLHKENTLRHEFGHAVDYRTIPPKPYILPNGNESKYQFKFTMLSDESKFVEAVKPNLGEVIYNRIAPDFADKYTPEQIKDLIAGRSLDLGDGRKAKLPPSYRKYLFQKKELFADGYAQYRLNPDKLKKDAPKLFEYFEELTNGR